jgi:thiosulfate dehydrogenase
MTAAVLALVLSIPLAMAVSVSGAACSDDSTGESPSTVEKGTTVVLCDGKTKVEIPPGAEKSRAGGQTVADALMSQWRQRHPDAGWEAEVRRSHPRIPPPADNADVLAAGGQRDGQTYGRYTEKDVLAWRREIERAVLEGARIFHDSEALGSTIGMSCDMCHPDAANTHPETYPKFQVQLGRVVLLRDMINWCIEHPLRGTAMTADDPRMRALETYIYAQRKGEPLSYGKH